MVHFGSFPSIPFTLVLFGLLRSSRSQFRSTMVSFRQNQRTDEIRLDLVKIWPDLDESRQDRPRSRQILLDLCLRERGGRAREWQASGRRSVGSVGVCFSCKSPPTNLPDLVSRSRDSPLSVANIRSDGFQPSSIN